MRNSLNIFVLLVVYTQALSPAQAAGEVRRGFLTKCFQYFGLVETVPERRPRIFSERDQKVITLSDRLSEQGVAHHITFMNADSQSQFVIVIAPDEATEYGRAAMRVARELPGAVLTLDPALKNAYSSPREAMAPWMRDTPEPWTHRVSLPAEENNKRLASSLDHEIGHGRNAQNLLAGVPGNYGRVSRRRGGGYNAYVGTDELPLSIRTLIDHVDAAIKSLKDPAKDPFENSYNGTMQKLTDAMLGERTPQEKMGDVGVLDLPGEVAQLALNIEGAAVSLHNAYAPIAAKEDAVSYEKPIVEGDLTWHHASFRVKGSGRTNVYIPIHAAWELNTLEKQLAHIETSAKAIADDTKKIHQWINGTQREIRKLTTTERREKLRIYLQSLKRLEKLEQIPSDPDELQKELVKQIQQTASSP